MEKQRKYSREDTISRLVIWKTRDENQNDNQTSPPGLPLAAQGDNPVPVYLVSSRASSTLALWAAVATAFMNA